MSRSYREPYAVDGYGSKWKVFKKRQANRKVRHSVDVPNDRAYRKFFDPWNICDWRIKINIDSWWSNWQQSWVAGTPKWKAIRK